MFDPTYGGSLGRDDILWWEQINQRAEKSPVRAIVKINSHYHAVILKENIGGKMDQVVADRLKYMCNLQPMHAAMVSLSVQFRSNHIFDCAKLPHLMFAAQFKIEKVHVPRFVFKQPTTLQKMIKAGWQLSNASEDFRLELCKIVLFRFLVGAYHSSTEHIIVLNDNTPISISEIYIGSCRQAHEFIDACTGDWTTKTTRLLIEKARKEITQNFFLDSMRGILLQREGPEREVKRHRPKRPITLNIVRMAELIEERLDILKSVDYEDLYEYLID